MMAIALSPVNILLRLQTTPSTRSPRSARRFRGVFGGQVLLSVALLIIGLDLPVAVADEGTPVVVDCGQPQVKPQHIILTCADNTWAIDNLVWRSWAADGATGSGIEFKVTCVPNCAQGSPTYSPVTITLTGATPPNFRYTSAVITNQNTGASDTWPMG
ncbi:hypothetical protein [Mycobacterium sp. 1245852.3]|uniref:hypothetical protein n=1 Tax=Mycobacterium sp. 1245852.3 TaxID=1856860 RepID=UPI0012EAF7EE|nr:hypothetical protein [Mycobacterium sp. 1245852.3]